MNKVISLCLKNQKNKVLEVLSETFGIVLSGSTKNGMDVFIPNLLSMQHQKLTRTFSQLHQYLLSASDGITLYNGKERLFGYGSGILRSIVDWNDKEAWKFSWGDKVDGYLCIGEDFYGNQYAYKYRELQDTNTEPRIYVLNNLTMDEVEVYSNFEEFFKTLIQKKNDKPQRQDSINPNTVVLLQPSILLTNGIPDEHATWVKIDVSQAMIINGDIFTQIMEVDENSNLVVKRMETYQDEKKRQRIRLVIETTEAGVCIVS